MKNNRYWVQKDTTHGVSQEYAISPVFSTQQAMPEWLREAKNNGLSVYKKCAAKAPKLRVNM